MSIVNLEALAEALYLSSYPYLHQGEPPRRVFQDARPYEQVHYRRYAANLAGLYEACCKPVEERTLKMRDVSAASRKDG